MKKYLVFLPVIFFISFAHAQNGFGFDIGVATSKAGMIGFKYFLDKNAFSLGASYQTNNALGKKVDEHPQNFIIGNGDFFYTLDAGYTRILSEKFSVEGELSFGKRKYYTNYNDDNAAQGAYHKIDKVKSIFGGGAMLFYNISETFVLFAGYNSIREGSFGLEVRFVKQNQY